MEASNTKTNILEQQTFNKSFNSADTSAPSLQTQTGSPDACKDKTTTEQRTRLTHRSTKRAVITRPTQLNTTPEAKRTKHCPDNLNDLSDADFVACIKSLIDHNQADALEEIPKPYFIEGKEKQIDWCKISNREGRFRYGDFEYVDRRPTLLHYAIEQEKPDCLQVLARKLPELIKMKNRQGHLPIHTAAQKGGTKSIEILTELDPALIQSKTPEQVTPLFLAIKEDHLDCIQYIMATWPQTITQITVIDGNSQWYDYQPLYALVTSKKTTSDTLRYFIEKVPAVFTNIKRVGELLDSMVDNNKPDCIKQLLTVDTVQQMITDIDSPIYFRKATFSHPSLFYKIQKENQLVQRAISGFDIETYQAERHRLAITPYHCSVLPNSIKPGHTTAARLYLIPGSKAIDYLHTATAFMASINKVGVFLEIANSGNEKSGAYWSLGDASASIQIMDTLIDLGAKHISLFVDITNGYRRIDDSNMISLAMDKLRLLLSESKPVTSDTVIHRRDCSVKIIVLKPGEVEEMPSVNFSFHSANTQIKNSNKLIHHTSFITVKPYGFAKEDEYLLTDINCEQGKANSIPLISPPHSVIEISPDTAFDDTHGNANVTIASAMKKTPQQKKWGSPGNQDNTNNINNSSTDKQLSSATALNNVDKLCTMGTENHIHISVVYGLHHSNVSPAPPLLQWVNAIKKQIENSDDKRPMIIAVFPNTDKWVIEALKKLSSQSTAKLIDMSDESAADQLDSLPDGQLILAQMPSLPRSTFNKLVSCSDYPALTEGANLTSYLLQTGHPYLSLLPAGDTAVPQDIGDALEGMKACALSYKLAIGNDDRQNLAALLELIQSEKYEEALTFIGGIKKTNRYYNPLQFLWGAMNKGQNPRSKPLLTVETLLKKCQRLKKSGQSLGSRGMEALLAAVDPDLNCYVSYLNNCMDKNSTSVNHAKLMQRHINQPFNCAVIYAITKFLQHKA